MQKGRMLVIMFAIDFMEALFLPRQELLSIVNIVAEMLKLAVFLCLTQVAYSYVGKTFVNADDGFSFASYYQENMVLQMMPHRAVVWGYGTVGAIVNVSLEQNVISTKVVPSGSGKKGVWKVTLPPHPAGGPHTIQAVEDNHGLLSWILLKNFLFGDVWICGGQSNMQFTMSMVFNSTEELALTSNYPNIRIMTPAEIQSPTPFTDFEKIEQSWSIPSPESVGGGEWTYFSAVCWLYGRQLYDSLKIPIGLVSPNWGGTIVEAWSSPRALKKCGIEKRLTAAPLVDARFYSASDNPNQNSVLWNAMVHPLLNMTIKGAVWYQGEANTGHNLDQYACSFPAMIADWRKSWFEGTGGQTHSQFPFGFVQIAAYYAADTGTYPVIRWRQTANHGYVPNTEMPNTFMAVAIDLGDASSPYGSIHPRDKQDVAHRLALGGLNVAYGKSVRFQGPFPQSAGRSGNGDVTITYDSDEKLAVSKEGNFQVCCSFSTCHYEEPSPTPNWEWAPITASTNNSVTVSAQRCVTNGGKAVMVRYAWAIAPCGFKKCSVYNELGLPGQPFYAEISG